MKHPESELQQECVKWFRYAYPRYANLLFAIPNVGKRSKIEAAIMKGEGVRAGVADLFLMLPRGVYHGLFIEMKAGKGVQTDMQKEFEADAIKHGYAYEVCRDIDQFMYVIKCYIRTAENSICKHSTSCAIGYKCLRNKFQCEEFENI